MWSIFNQFDSNPRTSFFDSDDNFEISNIIDPYWIPGKYLVDFRAIIWEKIIHFLADMGEGVDLFISMKDRNNFHISFRGFGLINLAIM